MISVLVAHLKVDHNLPAQGDIASFSLQWSGLSALALKKTAALRSMWLSYKKNLKKNVKGESTAKGPITALRRRPIGKLMLEMLWLKA